MTNIILEERICKCGCGFKFKVMPQSKQLYKSADCKLLEKKLPHDYYWRISMCDAKYKQKSRPMG